MKIRKKYKKEGNDAERSAGKKVIKPVQRKQKASKKENVG